MPTAAKKESGIMRCKASFSAQDKAGTVYTFHTGELIDGSHPVLKEKAWRELFEPIEDQFVRPEVETATASPGEKRGA